MALLVAGTTIAAVAGTTGGKAAPAAKKPIIIGAAVDLSGIMKPFDSAALLAARFEAARINAKGGVNGRKLKINVTVDPTLVGGVRVAVGDEVVDATAATRLAELRRRLAG